MAATSACDAWAVGNYLKGNAERTLILHWDGKAWQVQPSPSPGGSTGDSYLSGVAAVSASNAWAVGYYVNKHDDVATLVEHWNGTRWKVQPSPDPSTSEDELEGVTADSARGAWAVGHYFDKGGVSRTLVEHWNGTRWKVQPSLDPSINDNEFSGVAGVSASDVWAVGRNDFDRTLVERFNGTSWKLQSSRNPSLIGDELDGVAAVSAHQAWAVGNYSIRGGALRTLVEHWNGKVWRVQSSPNPGSNNYLNGVAAISASDAWAVGRRGLGALVEHWNGTAWKTQQSAAPSSSGAFSGVAALSAHDAWAVGYYIDKAGVSRTLVERWNGTAWKGS